MTDDAPAPTSPEETPETEKTETEETPEKTETEETPEKTETAETPEKTETEKTETAETPEKTPLVTRKRVLAVCAAGVVLGLILPLSNLVVGHPSGTVLTTYAKTHPEFQKVAPIFEAKCWNCHTSQGKIPFYAKLPIAGSIIQEDIARGTATLDMATALAPEQGPVSEVVLAKIEYELNHDLMPPDRYIALHWDAGMSEADLAAVREWIDKVRADHYVTGTAAAEFKLDVLQPIPDEVDLDARKVALGSKLYNDKRLSKDDTLSCASCHALDKGGTDQAKTSTGVGGAKGPINAPTVFNSGFQLAMFWDGRAATLEEQAAGPVHNPIEMGSSWEEVVPKLEKDPELVKEFQALYSGGITGERIVDAIACFERSLITPNSRFDQYLKGKADALDADELEGYRLFVTNGCATCHVGKILGGQSYEKMGVNADYFADRGDVKEVDMGRFNVTKKEEDRHKFKVPTLRNIALTFPYFHDASTSKLEEAVQTMAKYQGSWPLSDVEAEKVAKFLRTLTGEYKGKPLQ